jgi:3-deoxy-manno-octulosonate cytidylyltransferase (CMP-KDO synthetase)
MSPKDDKLHLKSGQFTSMVNTSLKFQLSEQAYVIIPARLESTRLPQKLLLRETGHSLLYHTYHNALWCPHVKGVCVATDSDEIMDEVNSFQGFAVKTGPHSSGTSRVSQAYSMLCCPNGDERLLFSKYIVNLQADEPSLTSDDLSKLIGSMNSINHPDISSLYFEISEEAAEDPNRVKVVVNAQDNAMYFSRYGIPFRGNSTIPAKWYQHVGVYAFTKNFMHLLGSAGVHQGMHCLTESLEQLAWLGQGYSIRMAEIDHETNGIDVRADYDQFVEEYKCRKSSS